MSEEIEDTVNLLDYPPHTNELQHWKGTGQLRWRSNSWDGDFALVRLLNGRLRFIFKLHNWRKSSDRFVNLYPLEFEGVAEDDSTISVTGIHFDMRYGSGFHWICTGYAHAAARRIEMETDAVSVRCDLTNYSLGQRLRAANFQLGGFDVTLERLTWDKDKRGVEEHATAYQHAPISTCLKIENIAPSDAERAIDCLREVTALLSIACRGFVSIAATHIWNEEAGKIDSTYEEPPFPNKKWGRPLIPSDSMEAFLDATYHTNESRVQKLEMAYMTDHYLQALTIHSIWPQSIGIFTAMETLKTAFYNRNTHLETHTEQGRRHSYRRLLATMFDVLCVNYRPEELQEFIGTRNKLIHEGTAVPANTPLSEYDEKSEAAWQQVGKAVNLFERALLAFLNYHGPCELFDEGFSSVS